MSKIKIALIEEEIKKAIAFDLHSFYKTSIKNYTGIGTLCNIYIRSKEKPSHILPAILVGFKINNDYLFGKKLIEDLNQNGPNSSIMKSRYRTGGFIRIYQYFDKESKKIKLILSNNPSIIEVEEVPVNVNLFENLFKIKIVGSELSARVFGLKKEKASLEGKIFDINEKEVEFRYGKSEKLNSETYYALVPYEDKKLKFVISDLMLIPNLIDSWNFPKDLTIRKGDIVRIIGDKSKFHWEVLGVFQTNLNFSKINRRSMNNIKDIVEIKSLDGGVVKKVFAKHLKKID